MNNKTAFVISCLVTLAVCVWVFITENSGYFGFLIGFLSGLVNIQWLFVWDFNKAIKEEIHEALRRYLKSLISRLGMITMVMAAVWRYQPEWLFYVVLGITTGIIIPLIVTIRQQFVRGGG